MFCICHGVLCFFSVAVLVVVVILLTMIVEKGGGGGNGSNNSRKKHTNYSSERTTMTADMAKLRQNIECAHFCVCMLLFLFLLLIRIFFTFMSDFVLQTSTVYSGVFFFFRLLFYFACDRVWEIFCGMVS